MNLAKKLFPTTIRPNDGAIVSHGQAWSGGVGLDIRQPRLDLDPRPINPVQQAVARHALAIHHVRVYQTEVHGLAQNGCTKKKRELISIHV